MKKVKYFALALLLTGGFAMTSCSDDDVATTQVTVGLNIRKYICYTGRRTIQCYFHRYGNLYLYRNPGSRE